MKKLFISGAIIIGILFLGIHFKDQILKSTVMLVASRVTGTEVQIQQFSLGVLSQTVKISGLKLYNPKGFPPGILADIPVIFVDYDLGALLKKKIHLRSVEVELKELVLEKNKEGKMNVDSLAVSKQEEPGKKAEPMPLQIDRMKLGIGRLVMKDYTVSKEPAIQVYDINIHKNYEHITSAQQLAALILTEPMKAAGIRGAAIYGVAALTGVAILPVGIAATFISKDSAQQEFTAGIDTAYQASLAVAKQMGTVGLEDRAHHSIRVTVNKVRIEIKLKETADKKTHIVVSARKLLFPKPQIAAGVLYSIAEKIK